MSDKQRLKRPKPERTQPIRSWSTLFGVPSNSRDAASDPKPATGSDGAASLQDVMGRSVDLGYRVVEEYIRRGQQAAQRVNDQSYGAQAMTNDFQEVSVRMAQYASDFATIWFEMLQTVMGGAARSPQNLGFGAWPIPTPAPTQRAPTTAPTPPEGDISGHTRVKIEIMSSRPTEVSLDLRPQAAARPVIVHALRAVDPDKPRLTDVTLQAGTADTPASLRIRVADDHPVGVYNGLIIDEESSRPVGTLSVRISTE